MAERRVIVFDVNETLLDLRALDAPFTAAFGDASARGEWFGQVLQSALTTVATGHHTDFGTIARGALDMTAERRGQVLTEEDRAAVFDTLRSLPPHPDAEPAMVELAAAGHRLAALTNSPPAVAEAQLANAGLDGHLEAILTVEAAGRLKPAPEPYLRAASDLGIEPDQLRLVAAHAWDVTGAIRAGCRAAFVARPGMVLDPVGETPDVVGQDLAEVAEGILAADG